MNSEGVFRTAPATMGLVKIIVIILIIIMTIIVIQK